MLYIASQEAMRKEDFLHGRTFESSNSPLAGVKANTKFEQRKARKGCFMKDETKVTAASTLAEKMGIKYREVDGLYYPIWESSDADSISSVGKYGHRWMRMLMEHDRYLYNRYLLDGTLIEKARANEEACWQLHEVICEKMKKSKGCSDGKPDTTEKFQTLMQIAFTAEEIVNADMYERIDCQKQRRLKKAKDTLMFEQMQLQRMED